MVRDRRWTSGLSQTVIIIGEQRGGNKKAKAAVEDGVLVGNNGIDIDY